MIEFMGGVGIGWLAGVLTVLVLDVWLAWPVLARTVHLG